MFGLRFCSRRLVCSSAARFLSNVSADGVKQLRTATGAPMSECKKALTDCNGNIQEAIDLLRKRGVAAAAKKSGRQTSCGLIAAAVQGKVGTLVEVNSETDFVERNELFQSMVKRISSTYLSIAQQGKTSFEELQNATMASSNGGEASVATQLTELVGVIRENLQLRRCGALSVKEGIVSSYSHNTVQPNIGKIGILIALESNSSNLTALDELGQSLSMHIASARPQYLNISDVPQEALAREREIIDAQVKESGKSGKALEMFIEGKIKSFYKEIVLNEQVHVLDEKKRSVTAILKDFAKANNCEVKIAGFLSFHVGA